MFVFVHIFKCGGTFFAGGLRYSYRPEQMCLSNIPESHPQSYWQKSDSEKKQVQLYHGHMPFGAHKELNRSSIYLTVVRDPINQLLSSYYNLREEKCKYNILHSVFHRYSFEECVLRTCWDKVTEEEGIHLAHFLDNHQTRVLSGTYKTAAAWKERTDQSLEISASTLRINNRDCEVALDNLERYFSFVGLCEQTDHYWELLHKRFGFVVPPEVWHSSNPYFSNATAPGRKRREDLSKEVIQSIQKCNKFDQQVYEWALKNKDRINSRQIRIIKP